MTMLYKQVYYYCIKQITTLNKLKLQDNKTLHKLLSLLYNFILKIIFIFANELKDFLNPNYRFVSAEENVNDPLSMESDPNQVTNQEDQPPVHNVLVHG